jgi:hypothetical protein
MLPRIERALREQRPLALAGILALGWLVLTIGFGLIPMAGGDDWVTFQGAAHRILSGVPLYGEKVTVSYYSNPPWLAAALIPLALLPARWGWAGLNALNLIVLLMLARRWTRGWLKPALVLTSPAAFYILLHGQVEPLILAAVFLPREWWLLAASTKPQIGLGLAFGLHRRHLLRAVVVSLGVMLLSLAVFGLWPQALLAQPSPFIEGAHNLWLGLWPFQVPAAVALILLGMRRDDERLLVSAAPFASPYATTSSLIGPWLAMVSFLKSWEAAVVWAAWWGAVVYRFIAGQASRPAGHQDDRFGILIDDPPAIRFQDLRQRGLGLDQDQPDAPFLKNRLPFGISRPDAQVLGQQLVVEQIRAPIHKAQVAWIQAPQDVATPVVGVEQRADWRPGLKKVDCFHRHRRLDGGLVDRIGQLSGDARQRGQSHQQAQAKV